MTQLQNTEFGGERPLYCEHDLLLEDVTIHLGESSLKETRNIEARHCTFEGKYVFWECRHFHVLDSLFVPSSRSSLWYSEDGTLERCQVDCPKMFRRMKGIRLTDCIFSDAQETLWDCQDVEMTRCTFENADYMGMHTTDVRLTDFRINGNYAFQYGRNIEIRNSLLNSKDALWESENVTVYDSEINGEYLAWYAKNLRLVRCHITGEQPLCYCENLILEDCTFGTDANLAFEYSTLQATIKGDVVSIKNPTSGSIHVEGEVGEIIIDENQKAPADCVIQA